MNLGRRPVRARTLLAQTAAMALLASGCGSAADAADDPGSVITIAYGAPTADHMVPSVTRAAGLFAKHGLKVKVEFLESTQLLPSLLSGDVQLVQLPAPGPELGAVNGTDFKQVAQIENAFDVIVASDADHPTMKSLQGRPVSVSKPGDFGWLLTQMMKRRYGIDFTQVPLGSLSSQVAAFESGEVDAIPDLSPNQLRGVAKKVPGVHQLVDWRSTRNVPGIQLIGYEPWMKAHRPTMLKLMRSINEGVAYYRDPANEKQTIGVISQETEETTEEATAGWKDALKALSPTIVPSVSAKRNVLSYVAHDFPEAAHVDPAQLIDASYATAVTK